MPGETHIAMPPTDSTFRIHVQLDVENFERLLKAWTNAQIGAGEAVDTLECDGRAACVHRWEDKNLR